MASKWKFKATVSSGDLPIPDVDEARIAQIRVDFTRGKVEALLVYGTMVGTDFQQSPINPARARQVIPDIEQYKEVRAAWDDFERKLFRRVVAEGLVPDGLDEDI